MWKYGRTEPITSPTNNGSEGSYDRPNGHTTLWPNWRLRQLFKQLNGGNKPNPVDGFGGDWMGGPKKGDE